ncbi:hypothetical protein V5O48_018959, partial [Marasmius crinis-equi]
MHITPPNIPDLSKIYLDTLRIIIAKDSSIGLCAFYAQNHEHTPQSPLITPIMLATNDSQETFYDQYTEDGYKYGVVAPFVITA